MWELQWVSNLPDEDCMNGIDDDEDQRADCSDADCDGHYCGNGGLQCVDGTCQ